MLRVLSLFLRDRVRATVDDLFTGRYDIAGFRERHFRKHRTEKLIDKDAEKYDITNDYPIIAESCRRYAHTERNACLREKRNAKVFSDSLIGF